MDRSCCLDCYFCHSVVLYLLDFPTRQHILLLLLLLPSPSSSSSSSSSSEPSSTYPTHYNNPIHDRSLPSNHKRAVFTPTADSNSPCDVYQSPHTEVHTHTDTSCHSWDSVEVRQWTHRCISSDLHLIRASPRSNHPLCIIQVPVANNINRSPALHL